VELHPDFRDRLAELARSKVEFEERPSHATSSGRLQLDAIATPVSGLVSIRTRGSCSVVRMGTGSGVKPVLVVFLSRAPKVATTRSSASTKTETTFPSSDSRVRSVPIGQRCPHVELADAGAGSMWPLMVTQERISIGAPWFDSDDELEAWRLFRQAVAHLDAGKVTIAFATHADVPDGVWFRVAEIASREGLDAVVTPRQLELRRPQS
jgi:hypothetical protein